MAQTYKGKALEKPAEIQLSDEQFEEALALIRDADSVELKLTVPESHQRSAVSALDMDPLEAQIRQVYFFDTPDLMLNQRGIVVRARRSQGRHDDSVVKLRPVVPNELPARLRSSPSLGVEVDAMPGGFVCSASLKHELAQNGVKKVATGTRPIHKVFSKEQRAFYAEHRPGALELDDLATLGPINVLKLKWVPHEYGRKLVAELWNYPDGSRILELSTKVFPSDGGAGRPRHARLPRKPRRRSRWRATHQDEDRARVLRRNIRLVTTRDHQLMNVALSALVVLAVTAAAVGAMLLVRRRAPDGSYFSDGDRASGVFGVLATGFAILLGLIIVLAFTSYDESRSGAESEALLVNQQFETAQFLPADARTILGNQLVCYARSVVHEEWPRMEDGSQGETINPWGAALFETIKAVEPETASEQSAYDKWLDQTSEREAARSDRIHGAVGVIPGPLWLVLFFIGAIVFVYILFFADRSERAMTQALLMGAVVAVIVATLLVISFLNQPFHPGLGSLEPVAMERTLDILEQERAVVAAGTNELCDAGGTPR